MMKLRHLLSVTPLASDAKYRINVDDKGVIGCKAAIVIT